MRFEGQIVNKPTEPLPITLPLFHESPIEVVVKRVIAHFDELCITHPHRAIKLINACNFQIRQLNGYIVRFATTKTEEEILRWWEKGAYDSAKRKIE